MNKKPLKRKNYGSIPHLPGSRLGPAEHHITHGQCKILTEKTRDFDDVVIVMEKLDGSNVGVCNVDGRIHAITRSGYLARTSPYYQHHLFADWVEANEARFDFLYEGERVCGEWLAMAHGTRYELQHEPFVVFDIMTGKERQDITSAFDRARQCGELITARIIHHAREAISIEDALKKLGQYGHHGAVDTCEGLVYRVERMAGVDFMAKYVRPEKEDGKYFAEKTGKGDLWNAGLDRYVKVLA